MGRTYNPDPIYGNGGSYMMGKGYLLNIIALYEFVCGSTKYDEPIELVYDDKIKFKYTQLKMAKVLYDQFTAPVDEGGSDLTLGIDCEVGKVFPWCVGVGGLGMKMTDKFPQRLARGVEAAPGEQLEPRVSLARQDFVIPDREGLPSIVTPIYAYRTAIGGRLAMWRRAVVASTVAGTVR